MTGRAAPDLAALLADPTVNEVWAAGYAAGLAAGRVEVEAQQEAAWRAAVAGVVALGRGGQPHRYSSVAELRGEHERAEHAREREARAWAGWAAS